MKWFLMKMMMKDQDTTRGEETIILNSSMKNRIVEIAMLIKPRIQM